MPSEISRSSVFAIREESTAGTLIDISAGSQFIPLREGFSFLGNLESVDTDELQNSIGRTKSFVTRESPNASIPLYVRHSGTEGQAPEFGPILKAMMGTETLNATEYDTIAGSTAGTSSAAATVVVDSGEGSNFVKGQGLLIKDGTNGYVVRNVRSISTDTLTLSYNLSGAPASGVNLGKAVHYVPSDTGHPSFSAHLYQASSSSALHQAMAGCLPTSVSFGFEALGLATMDVEFTGTKYFYNPIFITAGSNDKLDFSDSNPTTYAVTLEAKAYKTAHQLATEIQTKMNATASGDTYTVTYSNTTGKFTIASDATPFSLLWNTGTNTATSCGTTIGFAVAADDTSAQTYTSDNAITFSPSVTPAYDDQDSIIVKGGELLIGDFDETTCRQASNVSFSITTPITQVPDICDESGISENLILSREATLTATLILQEFEQGLIDKFLNNTSTTCAFTTGTKDSAGAWQAGLTMNIYFANCTISSHVVDQSDGYMIVNVEAKGFVDSNQSDVHVNFL